MAYIAEKDLGVYFLVSLKYSHVEASPQRGFMSTPIYINFTYVYSHLCTHKDTTIVYVMECEPLKQAKKPLLRGGVEAKYVKWAYIWLY